MGKKILKFKVIKSKNFIKFKTPRIRLNLYCLGLTN